MSLPIEDATFLLEGLGDLINFRRKAWVIVERINTMTASARALDRVALMRGCKEHNRDISVLECPRCARLNDN